MPPSLARWEACHHLVEAAILAASKCGFQPRVPKADTVSNCTHLENAETLPCEIGEAISRASACEVAIPNFTGQGKLIYVWRFG
jgi:hypothetical protein